MRVGIGHLLTYFFLISIYDRARAISCHGGRRPMKHAVNFDTYDCPALSSCYARVILFNDSDSDAVIEKGCLTTNMNTTYERKCEVLLPFKKDFEDGCSCSQDFCNTISRPVFIGAIYLILTLMLL